MLFKHTPKKSSMTKDRARTSKATMKKKRASKICSFRSKRTVSNEFVHVSFTGFNTSKKCDVDYLRVDESGSKRCLKWMDKRDEIMIPDRKITVRFELEFDKGPFDVTFKTKRREGFTRQKLAKCIIQQYHKMFQRKSRYGVWVKRMNLIGVLSLSGKRHDVYTLWVDIN